jgi:hypothetical protein
MVFLIELGIMSYARPKYACRVPFWLDLLAAISLIGDIPFFASSVLPSGFAAARAGRAARAGTKAGRLVRLIRLTRLVSIYGSCVFERVSSYCGVACFCFVLFFNPSQPMFFLFLFLFLFLFFR